MPHPRSYLLPLVVVVAVVAALDAELAAPSRLSMAGWANEKLVCLALLMLLPATEVVGSGLVPWLVGVGTPSLGALMAEKSVGRRTGGERDKE